MHLSLRVFGLLKEKESEGKASSSISSESTYPEPLLNEKLVALLNEKDSRIAQLTRLLDSQQKEKDIEIDRIKRLLEAKVNYL